MGYPLLHSLVKSETPVEQVDLSLSDLFPVERLQILQDQLARTHRLAMVMTDLDGSWITQPSQFTKLCEVMQRSEKVKMRCDLTYRVIAESMHETGAPAMQECLNCGLIEAGFPIFVAGQHVANCMVGQNNALKVGRQRIEESAWLLELDVLEVRNAYAEVPAIPMDRFTELLELMSVVMGELAAQAYQAHQLEFELNRQRQIEGELRQKALGLVQASSELREFIHSVARDFQDMLRMSADYLDDRDNLKTQVNGAQVSGLVEDLFHKIRRSYRRILDGMALEQSQRAEMEKELYGSRPALARRFVIRSRKPAEDTAPEEVRRSGIS